jgi:hypothetical protein
MRYEKKVAILAGSLAALLLAWGLGLVFSPGNSSSRSEAAKLLSAKAAEVASVSLASSPNASIELAKSSSSWELVDSGVKLPAQGSRVSSFLDEVAAVSRLSPIARSKESWAGLGLDEVAAKHAVFKDAKGKVLADFYVGSYGPTGSEVFVRRAGSDESYSVQSTLSSYLESARSNWLDLQVMAGLKDTDVQSFSVKSDILLDAKGKARTKLDYEIKRDGKGWKLGGSGSAASLEPEEVASLLRSLSTLQGEDYIAQPPADAFASLSARVALELGSGKSKVLEVGTLEKAATGAAGGEGRFYARIAGGGPTFLLSAYSLRSDLKSLSELEAKKK